jgi:excisionase family DNA binding protein
MMDVTERYVYMPPELTAEKTFCSPWMTYAGAIAYTQFSRSKIEKAATANTLRSTGSGKNRRFHREWLDAWMIAGSPTSMAVENAVTR